MSDDIAFTGERLHAGSQLFGVDLARHRAAYVFAAERAAGKRVLDLGCGSGYGAAELALASESLVGVDRIRPDAASRGRGAQFLRADLHGIPLRPRSFDLVVSFQVIEHLEDPSEYLEAMSALVRDDGCVLITTPNILTSDRVNPYHVHEYEAEELRRCLAPWFGRVEMRGVGASPPVARYLDARLQRIRRIMRLDPLGLRDRLPRPLVEWLFAAFAKVVRRGIQKSDGLPDVGVEDFPIGPPSGDCVDLLAVCSQPRAR